jgi:hypothetical protein
MQNASDTGSVMSNELVGAGLAVDEQFDQMHLATQGLKNILFEALAPAIHAVVSALVSMMKGMIASYRAGGTVYIIVKTLAAGFKVLASIVVGVGGVFAAFAHVAVAAITAVFGPIYTLGKALVTLRPAILRARWPTSRPGRSRHRQEITSARCLRRWVPSREPGRHWRVSGPATCRSRLPRLLPKTEKWTSTAGP